MKNRSVIVATISFAITCFAALPGVQAVVPPPDGGYPGLNTAEGDKALFNLTTGSGNTAIGWFSLFSNTDGSFNTAVGAGTLLFNVGNASTFAGLENTAVGAAALLFNTSGDSNTAVGVAALLNNTEGVGNTATGVSVLSSNTVGSNNTAIGEFALLNNTEGGLNTGIGASALISNTDGTSNTATGFQALTDNTTGFGNTAVGQAALGGNTEGDLNTAVGFMALANNIDGVQNTANGNGALGNNTAGSGNIALGIAAGSNVTDADNVIAIGHPGANVDNSCFIGHIHDALVAPDAVNVLIDSAGKLGTTTGSSRRFKNDIKPIDRASEAILALQPVTFHYKSDKTNTTQFGLIAEQVSHVNPDLVVRDKDGKPYAVRYDSINVMLLNEFLKEHRKIEDEDLTITQLKTALAQQQKVFDSKLAEQEQKIGTLTADVQRLAANIEVNNVESRTLAEKRRRFSILRARP